MATITATTDNSMIDRAIKVAFDRIQNEPQQSKNLLKAVFSRKGNTLTQKYKDFADEVSSSDIDEGDILKVRRDTVAPQVPTFRRRHTKLTSTELRLIFPRAHARKTGMTVEALADIYTTLGRAEIARAEQRNTLRLLCGSYKENGDFLNDQDATLTAASDTILPLAQESIRIQKLGDTTVQAYLSLAAFFGTRAEFDNELGDSGVMGTGGITMSIEDIKKVAIFSNNGWAQFMLDNADIVANSDYFGKPVYIKGYGEFKMLHDFLIVTLPDGEFHDRTFRSGTGVIGSGVNVAGGAFFDGAPAVTSGFYKKGAALDGTTDTDAATVSVKGMYQCIMVNADNLMLYQPEQLNVNWEKFSDFGESMERNVYGQFALEGLRCYDSLIRRHWFLGKDVELVTSNS